MHLPLIEDIAFVGDIFGQLNLLIWMGLALVVVTWVVVFRTPPGLRLRSAGENPLAAETAGLSVVRTRYLAVVTSGVLAGAGGAYLSIGFVHSFSQNMTIGKGFIALAALIFGRWRPGGALMAALLFGFSTALAQRLPVFSPSAATLFQALPYVLTLIAVAGLVGRSIAAGRDRPPARAVLAGAPAALWQAPRASGGWRRVGNGLGLHGERVAPAESRSWISRPQTCEVHSSMAIEPHSPPSAPANERSEQALFQPGVAERATRVQPRGERGEVAQARVARGELVAARVEDLAPVRARLERGERGLDDLERARRRPPARAPT